MFFRIPTYEAITSIDEDEKELDRATEFEKKYNFRYEEPDNDFVSESFEFSKFIAILKEVCDAYSFCKFVLFFELDMIIL